jgi:hypothetical protein
MDEALDILEERARQYRETKPQQRPVRRAPGVDFVEDMAEALATKHRLVAYDGSIFCWGCGVEGASWPTLHCADCVARVRTEKARGVVRFTKYGHWYEGDPTRDDDHRWKGMIDNMRNDKRLDRQLAKSLLDKAKKVPGASKYHEALTACFTRRFGEQTFAEVAMARGGYADD